MRSVLMAVVVLSLGLALLSRSVQAGPRMAPTPMKLKDVIAALSKDPAQKSSLAAARFYGEVFGGTDVEADSGSVTQHNALSRAQDEITRRSCGALKPEELKAASALLKEYGDALPLKLRAYTMGLEGKTKPAADLFASSIESMALPAGACPGEHPDASYGRLNSMNFSLRCVQAFEPKRDVSKLLKIIERAQQCGAQNTAVG